MKRAAVGATLLLAVGCGVGDAGERQPPPPINVNAFTPGAHESAAVPSQGAPQSLESQQLKAIAAFDDAITRRPENPDSPIAAKIGAVYAPNATLWIPGVTEPPISGRDQIAATLAALYQPIQPRDFAASRLLIRGNVMAVQWEFRGGLNDKDGATEWRGVKPTHDEPEPLGFAGFSVWTFSPEGLIVQDHTYFDVLNVYAQLDAAPAGTQKGDMPTVSTGDPQKVVAKMNADEDQEVDLLKKATTAEQANDETTYLSLLSDKMLHEGPRGLLVGLEPAKAAFEDGHKTWGDLKIQDNAFAVGEYVVNEYAVSGTQVGPLGQTPATKKPATWHGGEVLQIRDGKIIHEWVYANRMEILTQLGIWNGPAAPPPATPATPNVPTPKH